MRKALALLITSYAVLVALFVAGSKTLAYLRIRLVGGFTVGDVIIVLFILLYGVVIYITGLWAVRVTCKNRRRDS
ncbi:MAG: hypothetical protein ABWK05_06245 [Pyrobaculum sp.]